MRGIGGVIQDSLRTVVKKNSGPVSSLDSNRAEVYALWVGYHELHKLGGYKAIKERGQNSCNMNLRVLWNTVAFRTNLKRAVVKGLFNLKADMVLVQDYKLATVQLWMHSAHAHPPKKKKKNPDASNLKLFASTFSKPSF